LAALFLPYNLKLTLDKFFGSPRAVNLTVLAFLALPFFIFTITTPQNLAYLFLILVILIGLRCQVRRELALMMALSLAAILTQAVAGLPALIFTLILAAYHSDLKLKTKAGILAVFYIALAAAVPVAFYFISGHPGNIQNNKIISGPFFGLLAPANPIQENLLLNSLYFYIKNLGLAYLVLIAAGLFIIIKYRRNCRIFWLYLVAGLAMLASYLILSGFNFAYLVDYERFNFPLRLLLVSALFFLPLAWLPLYGLINKIIKQARPFRLPWLIFLGLAVLASLYASYPRFDRYHNSHSYTVSRADIEAVRWIENDAGATDYVVLANQQVSAAALKEYGFKKYYKPTSLQAYKPTDLVFYYPIPTGGPLYQYYLDMVYETPDRETAVSAMELVDAGTAYFVLNDYWWAFDKIYNEAKLAADSFKKIEQGKILIFKYKRRP
jgi:hypothetical protein